ncbi:three component ABC system middle component [Serratia marcescens]|uniref:three component ABC system middle component n=2 Tax=Serratia marcescens TaxID=615 RepID=UPI00157CE19C|nr:three component ABC system middle component [Serratia marcescens]
MRPKEISSLLNSPLWIALLLKYFLSGAQKIKKNGIDLEVIYLSIPFILNESVVDELSHGNKSSNLSKITTNPMLRGEFIASRDLITFYKSIVKTGLITLASSCNLKIGNKIYLENVTINFNSLTDSHVKKHCKAAYNLGAILAKEESVELLIRFGAK